MKKIVALAKSKSVDQIIADYLSSPYPVAVKPAIQHYAWGEKGEQAFIPQLLGVSAQDKPWAELWYGVHDKAPAQLVIEGVSIPANRVFSHIPWLFKILAAGETLSIQVHPNASQAKAGYEAEMKAGVPPEKRSYLDPNPKPEIAVPLTHFWAMNGFMPKDQIVAEFCRATELFNYFKQEILALYHAQNSEEVFRTRKQLYEKIMTLPTDTVDQFLKPFMERLQILNQIHPFQKDQKEYWLLKADQLYRKNGHFDVGLISFYLLNLVHLIPFSEAKMAGGRTDAIALDPGTAIFSEAGVPHFYLEGVCAENMTNSDNVLRAGLTPKFKNIPELLKIVNYSDQKLAAITPQVLVDRDQAVQSYHYPSPSASFETILVKQLQDSVSFYSISHDQPLVLLVMEGEIKVRWADQDYVFKKGESVLIPPSSYQKASSVVALKDSVFFKVSVPAS